MTWGHAVSTDLVHWEQLDHAIHPDSLGTIFSGSAVVDWNNTAGFGKEAMVCIYTTGDDTVTPRVPVTQCIAYSTDQGRTFTKYAKNPVLGHIAGSNRDPKVFWHTPTKMWIMTLYLDKNDFALLSSPDLKQWKQIQAITMPDCDECPDLFPMAVDGDTNRIKWVLTAANGRYFVGDFDGRIRLRILVDRSSIELFGNDGKLVMTSCFMPWPENKALGLQCLGETANVSVNVHTLRSTWNI